VLYLVKIKVKVKVKVKVKNLVPKLYCMKALRSVKVKVHIFFETTWL